MVKKVNRPEVGKPSLAERFPLCSKAIQLSPLVRPHTGRMGKGAGGDGGGSKREVNPVAEMENWKVLPQACARAGA